MTSNLINSQLKQLLHMDQNRTSQAKKQTRDLAIRLLKVLEQKDSLQQQVTKLKEDNMLEQAQTQLGNLNKDIQESQWKVQQLRLRVAQCKAKVENHRTLTKNSLDEVVRQDPL
ncbi:hypothetical protein HDU76_001553 [Blyttiomyces sp. JEL0837]|nr:hypothetical protein HDU76_001553 [Blyttiomyces sp. JEL0837]